MVDLTLPDATLAPDVGDAAGRLVDRVRAWQHRHPLARRIAASEVVGLGVIALPYGPGPQGQAEALFHQPNLLPGLSHRALLAFADRHAVGHRPGPPGWPLRQIERSDASPEPAPQTRYLFTAAISDAHPRSALPHRVLIAPESPAIWGTRQWSRSRLAVAALGAILVLALAVAGLRAALRRPATGRPVPAVVAVSASAPASGAPTVPAPMLPAASLPVATAAAASQAPALLPAASAASTPAPRQAVASAPGPASSPAAVAPPRLLPMPHQAQAASAPPSASASAPALTPPVAVGTHYALVSVPAKKREVAEATLERVRKLLGPAIGPLQAQVMPSPEGYVVTIWPLPTEADAERLAEVLARRGVPMKWLEF
ncbi:MAG TPA: hypothetical protein VGQ91_15945 [Ideonella sp.]|jgi:hypothetical protein|nr:hypothetical protein [Ideonella sp.]